MSEHSFNREAWLGRIGYTGSRAPTLDRLRGLVDAHSAATSYEGIDVLLDRPPKLDLNSLQRKMIAGGRGGYCFEQNMLFRGGLRALGFDVTSLQARVVRGLAIDARRPMLHMVLQVNLLEGPYLADVGFGKPAPTAPLKLGPDLEQDTPHEVMRFIRMGDELTLQSRLGDRWEHIYRVVLLPRVDAEYEICNWFTASHPDSPYRSNLIAARPGPDRTRITLFNARLNSLSGAAVGRPTGLAVHEHVVLHIDRGKFVLLGPVVLVVLPFRLVAALRQQVHAAHHVARIEILGIDPGQQRHVVVFRPQRRRHLLGAGLLHMIEQLADEVGDQVDAQRPAGAEIAEHPDQIRHAGEHHAAIGHGIGEIQLLAVDREFDVAVGREVEAGRGDDDVGFQLVAGFQQNALLGEAVDLVGDDRGLAGLDALEQVAIGDEGDALPPRPVRWREVGGDVVILAEIGLDRGQQILLGRLGLLKGLAGERVLIEQDFAAGGFLGPRFVALPQAQRAPALPPPPPRR